MKLARARRRARAGTVGVLGAALMLALALTACVATPSPWPVDLKLPGLAATTTVDSADARRYLRALLDAGGKGSADAGGADVRAEVGTDILHGDADSEATLAALHSTLGDRLPTTAELDALSGGGGGGLGVVFFFF
jgi:hypothetical protein